MIAILSGNAKESKQYAKRHKLEAGAWKHIAGLHSILGADSLDVRRTGSWKKRRDLAVIEELLQHAAAYAPKG